MTSDKSEITRRKAFFPTAFDDIFEGFRRDIEDRLFFPTWSFLGRGNDLLSHLETRHPLCDMEDLGDKYEVTLDTPGIPKDKITVKAGTDYIDISGEQEKKTEEKRKNYLYNERSYSSLRRRISTPEEIDPSKIDAKMENGVLHIQVPKKTPTQNKETKVEVK
ncbi:MAG TPA: Hsp20/alpha crystallin family protein [Nitrososphaeraceae archaeon]